MLNFIEELKWRGMLHQMMPGIEEVLANGKCVGYIGFDPTAPSLTIGNYVQLMLLSMFQRAGHQPIVLMGGATGRIGDPSGKEKERELKSYEELDGNLAFQVEQMKKFLNFETGDNKAILVNNYDFYKEMNVLDFLRNVGKTLTVNYMQSKDSVKKRLNSEEGGEGMSFTEFSYQLLQGYDFQCLYDQYNCNIQMGGSDQWGNITSGTEFIRRNVGGKAYAITTPLLTKADGSKFGKSEQGNIWLDAKMTTPYQFYQFWINTADADLSKYFRYFSMKSKEEIEALEAEHATNPNQLKRILAEELTRRIHSDEDFESAFEVTRIVFAKGDKSMLEKISPTQFEEIAETIGLDMKKEVLEDGLGIVQLLAGEDTKIYSSNSEARKAILNNAISLNKVKVSNHEMMIGREDLIHDRFLFVENGKTKKIVIVFN
ncbi:MAG: tyrosine--tRNA ligase [Saprospiraceae bacterium]